jgi:uroporphyrinogen-III synthase
MNAEYYSNLLSNDRHQAIRKQTPRKLSKNILLYYVKSLSHTENLTMTLATVGWEVMKYPAYRLVLALSDFHSDECTIEDTNFKLIMSSNAAS